MVGQSFDRFDLTLQSYIGTMTVFGNAVDVTLSEVTIEAFSCS